MRWSEVRDRLLTDPAARRLYEEQGPLHRFGASVAVRRWALRLTQSELAEKAGVTQRQISMLENGKANLTAATLVKIASALDGQLAVVAKIQEIRLPWASAASAEITGVAYASLTSDLALGDLTYTTLAASIVTGTEVFPSLALQPVA